MYQNTHLASYTQSIRCPRTTLEHKKKQVGTYSRAVIFLRVKGILQLFTIFEFRNDDVCTDGAHGGGVGTHHTWTARARAHCACVREHSIFQLEHASRICKSRKKEPRPQQQKSLVFPNPPHCHSNPLIVEPTCSTLA